MDERVEFENTPTVIFTSREKKLSDVIVRNVAKSALSMVQIARFIVTRYFTEVGYYERMLYESRLDRKWMMQIRTRWEFVSVDTVRQFVCIRVCDDLKGAYPAEDLSRLIKMMQDNRKKIVEACQKVYQDQLGDYEVYCVDVKTNKLMPRSLRWTDEDKCCTHNSVVFFKIFS